MKPREITINWVIAGGESGAHARPSHPNWFRFLRDECAAANVPFLFKQWGEWVPTKCEPGGDLGGDMRRGLVEIVKLTGEQDGHFVGGDCLMRRVGKKRAGRKLNNITHNQFPDFSGKRK